MKQKPFLRAFMEGVASIGEGMASIFNLRPCAMKPPSYEQQFGTDAELLASDWKKVGNDFRTVLEGLEKETKGTSK